jgi:phenylacetate-CoA ligase
MSFLNYVRNRFTRLPYAVGVAVAQVPYSWRPGIHSAYRRSQADREWLDGVGIQEKREFIFRRVKNIVEYASTNVPFYRDLYRAAGINPAGLRAFEDLDKLPVIRKEDLQGVPLEYRSAPRAGRYLVNTGGSSGQPLEFYIEPNSVGHEWAHMHRIWSRLGFRQSDLTIVFGGRADVRDVVEYDSARHRLVVDSYSGWPAVADRLNALFRLYSPRYLHGYPSSVFDFVIWLDSNDHPLLAVLRRHIRGMLLGSELPAPRIRDEVEKILGCRSVSWYGHTERSVLAYESEQYGHYSPFLSYGFAESVKADHGNRLICTNYYNYASPLIRYDTGDLIDASVRNGILESFMIREGREGEYILDKHYHKIFLTALIFGRHHVLFERARYIQIQQSQPGYAEVLVVPREGLTSQRAAELFDCSNVLIDFSFKIIEEPKRTAGGKVTLLVREIL